jgi:hypothetical protein
MSFNLTGLAGFTNENSGILIKKSVLGADLMNYITVYPGYSSGTVSINVLNTDTTNFVDASCGWPAGATGTQFSQIDVTVSEKEWKESLCQKDLRNTWLSMQISASAFNEEIPFEQMIAESKVEQVKKAAEAILGSAIIAGSTVSAGATLQAGATATAWTSSTAIAQANSLIDALPSRVLASDDLMMFMSYASFRALTQALAAINYFHYPVGGDVLGKGLGQKVIIPGTNVTAVPVAGFGSSNRVICGPASKVIAVVGLMDDMDKLKIWYSLDNDEVRTHAAFRIGAGLLADHFSTNNLA